MHLLDNMTQLVGLTHMPFRTASTLFFCGSEEPTATGARRWKIHFLDQDGNVHRLRTRMASDAMECSPTAWHDGVGWHISFASGGVPGNPRFYIYLLEGKCLSRLGPPVSIQAGRTGFVYRNRTAWGEPVENVHILDGDIRRKLVLPDTQIYRVSYRSDMPEVLLITVQVIEHERFATIEYNLKTRVQQEIECDGEPAYKCSVLKDEVWFAHRSGDGFEDRQVRRAKLIERLPTQLIESDEVAEE